MKTYGLVPARAVSAITCDRCATVFIEGGQGSAELQSIEFVAGFGSVFGDGNTVSIDLCQECLKHTLGQWMRISTRPPIDPRVLRELRGARPPDTADT